MGISDLEKAIAEASRLPLLDVAFLLRDIAEHLDEAEGFSYWRDHGGHRTRDRLLAAHPEASLDEAMDALRAASKLTQDCLLAYKQQKSAPRWMDGIDRAVEIARQENPGFQDGTYGLAHSRLAWAMR